jgi:hypothetical protein
MNEIGQGKLIVSRTFVIHKVLSEFFQISLIVVKCDQLVMVIERDDGIFRVTGNVNNLFTKNGTKYWITESITVDEKSNLP